MDFLIHFVYQKSLIQTFQTSFLTTYNQCEFTALEQKFQL